MSGLTEFRCFVSEILCRFFDMSEKAELKSLNKIRANSDTADDKGD